MIIRAGFEIVFECPNPTPMVLMLNIHPSREPDLLTEHRLMFNRPVPITIYDDSFGNRCSRIVAPTGQLSIMTDFQVRDFGEPDRTAPGAVQVPVEELPTDILIYLLGSRYCETDRLSDIALSLFGHVQGGWARVQAICDFVHQCITFDYASARPTKTAWEAFMEQRGVCRDFAHLAVTFCRCMNIPARYCTGYLGDIGVPYSAAPMDFSAWFDVYLGGRWYTCDARHNRPRIGRILMARGRDATDVAITTTFGSNVLVGFTVITEEILAFQR
ncbi:MAG: transglutaminase family protein [Acidiphilium sp.]|nr:transglutaminase family protein [Acidiphilium sp.]MDD4936118.1 transglutaminase family protein [Acidiphilium sp.]